MWRSKGLWLTVQKVIHHDDVVLLVIVRPRGDVASGDPDPGDARVVKHDTEEGQAPIAGRSRDETAENQLAVDVEVLQPCAGPLWAPALFTRPNPIRLVHVGEDRAKATDRGGLSAGCAGDEEPASVRLLPTGVNRRNGLKVLKMSP